MVALYAAASCFDMATNKVVRIRIGIGLLVGCASVSTAGWLLDVGIVRMLIFVVTFVLLPSVGGILPALPFARGLLAIGGFVPMVLVGPLLWWIGLLGETRSLPLSVGWGLFILGASLLQVGIIVIGRSYVGSHLPNRPGLRFARVETRQY